MAWGYNVSSLLIGALLTALLVAVLATIKAPRLVSVLWWALVATMCITAAIAMNLPGDVRENLTALLLIIPLIWVGLQFWAYWDHSKWRVAGGMVGLCVVSGVVISISSPLG